MTRKNISLVFLLAATAYWGIWLGGYIFNALMVVPSWSYNAPGSLLQYDKSTHILVYFFTAVNPWVFLVSLAAWLFLRKVDTAGRSWLGRGTLIAWIMLPLKVWMIFVIGGVFMDALQGTFEARSLNMMNIWIRLNWVTVAAGFVIFFAHLMAVLSFHSPQEQNIFQKEL
jgi:hypothetical protein